MRFDISPEISSCRLAGMSPVLKLEMVGKDNSSATHGSSTVNVAGKKRLPTKQCADPGETPQAVKPANVTAIAASCRGQRRGMLKRSRKPCRMRRLNITKVLSDESKAHDLVRWRSGDL